MWGVDREWLSFWRQLSLKSSYKKAQLTPHMRVYLSACSVNGHALSLTNVMSKLSRPQGVSSFKASSAFLQNDLKRSSAVFLSTLFSINVTSHYSPKAVRSNLSLGGIELLRQNGSEAGNFWLTRKIHNHN